MIYYHSEDIDFSLSNSHSISHWLSAVAHYEQFTIRELNYIFCSDSYLLDINLQYLDHDYFTDIITFDLRDDFLSSTVEGDIFVSIDRVVENARDLSISFENEIKRVLVHGLLHLLGYEDSTNELMAEMRCLEDKYLGMHSDY